MEFIQKVMKKLYKTIIFLSISGAFLFSKSVGDSESLHETWKSVNNSKYKVWFQNWSGYTRLFLTINEDTLTIEPNKYATQKKAKPYLFPKPYEQIFKKQLIGNIIWDSDASWEEGNVNTFTYIVDRANPKIRLPEQFEGLSVIENGQLRLELISGPEKKHHMILKPTFIE